MFGDSSILTLILVVIAAGAGIGLWLTHRRHERFAELAGQRGWTYHRKMQPLRRQIVEDVRGGRSGNAFVSVFEGRVGDQPFYAGTAQWTESRGSGDNRRTETIRRRALTRQIPLNAPHMRLEKEGLLRNIFNRDLKTEWEEFNRAWIINGDDPRFVSAVLSPTMQQWLMRHRDANYVLRPGWVTVYTSDDRRLDYDDVDPLLAISTGFSDEIAPFLWQDYGSGRPS